MSLGLEGPIRGREPVPRRSSRRRAGVAVGVVALAGAAALALTVDGDPSRPEVDGMSPTASNAVAAARQFLAGWTDPDGRVVRRDQGGDTVSEGQGYGMLLAVAAGDRARFTRIWDWTRANLQQPDGSIAWHWSGGAVVDTEQAPDGDLDIAQALLVAARDWHVHAWDLQARRIAGSVYRQSTVAAAPGRLVTGGPWANGGSSTPAEIDTSYLVAGTATNLAAATQQPGWHSVADATQALDHRLLSGAALPPDWVSVEGDAATATPARTPGSGQTARYGLEAPRLLVRLAASCLPADRALAARAPASAIVLGAPAERGPAGNGLVDWTSPVTDVGAAAVLTARGDRTAAAAALDQAARQDRAAPTYYGSAWVALGRVLLTTDRLDTCATAGGTR